MALKVQWLVKITHLIKRNKVRILYKVNNQKIYINPELKVNLVIYIPIIILQKDYNTQKILYVLLTIKLIKDKIINLIQRIQKIMDRPLKIKAIWVILNVLIEALKLSLII